MLLRLCVSEKKIAAGGSEDRTNLRENYRDCCATRRCCSSANLHAGGGPCDREKCDGESPHGDLSPPGGVFFKGGAFEEELLLHMCTYIAENNTLFFPRRYTIQNQSQSQGLQRPHKLVARRRGRGRGCSR